MISTRVLRRTIVRSTAAVWLIKRDHFECLKLLCNGSLIVFMFWGFLNEANSNTHKHGHLKDRWVAGAWQIVLTTYLQQFQYNLKASVHCLIHLHLWNNEASHQSWNNFLLVGESIQIITWKLVWRHNTKLCTTICSLINYLKVNTITSSTYKIDVQHCVVLWHAWHDLCCEMNVSHIVSSCYGELTECN